MAQTKINARDIIVEVSDGATTPTWIEIDGLNSVTINRAENEELTDTTTYASQGDYETEAMQRGASMALAGFVFRDDSTGEQDPGQARCEELATLKATESLGQIRFRHPVQTDWTQWTAVFSSGEQGGGNNAKTAWAMNVVKSGASSTVEV